MPITAGGQPGAAGRCPLRRTRQPHRRRHHRPAGGEGRLLVPTLVTYEQMYRFGKQAGLPEASRRKVADVRDGGLVALEKAHKAGVNIVYGSDLLGPLHGAQLDEFTCEPRCRSRSTSSGLPPSPLRSCSEWLVKSVR